MKKKEEDVTIEDKIHIVSELLFRVHHQCIHILMNHHSDSSDDPIELISEALDQIEQEMQEATKGDRQ